jgi:VWFA-related protein
MRAPIIQTYGAAFASTLVLSLLIAINTPSAQTPQSPQVFRGATTLVPVDIRVLDRDGKPVTDLRQSDFTLLENGVPQAIRHFSTQGLTAETAAAAGSLVPRAGEADAISPQHRRIFLLVLARGRLQGVRTGIDGMLHFVRERLLPQDLVAVLAWNRATEFTTDHARIADMLERFKRAHEGLEAKMDLRFSDLAGLYGSKDIPASLQRDIDAVFGGAGARGVRSVQPGVSPNASRVNDDTRRTTDTLLSPAPEITGGETDPERRNAALDEFVGSSAQTMQDLGNVYVGVEYLRRIEGEKHLVFVSASGLALPRAEDDLDLVSAASDARVVIDYIHVSGTSMSPSQAMFEVKNQSVSRGGRPLAAPAPTAQTDQREKSEMWKFSTARTLAEQTGGHFYANRFSNVATDMDHIDEATRSGYILGYYPSNPAMDGKYRHIVVRVNRPGLTVLYRHGYFARPTIEPFNLRRIATYTRIAAASNYSRALPDIKVQATASLPNTATVPLQVLLDLRIDPARLTFTKRDGRNVKSIELAIFLVDGEDRLVGQTWKTVELTFTDDRFQSIMREGVTMGLAITVTAPPTIVKTVVYDPAADLIGSAIVKVR